MNEEKEKVLEVKDLTVSFQTYAGKVQAVRKSSFDLYKKETLAIVGESGSGKSVTVKTLMGLLGRTAVIENGTVMYKGRNLTKFTEKDWEKIRGRDIAMIFQDPLSSLNPIKKIGKQISEIFTVLHKMPKAEAKEQTLELMKAVGIPEPEKRYNQYPFHFSGGMRQRIVIAIALASNPDILICDEPTTALDVTIQAQILELMEDIRAKKNTGILMITHDLGVVAEMCSRVVVMYAGRIVEEAPVQELFADPKHPYTQGLIGSVPKLGSGVESLPSIPGSVPDLSVMPKGCKFAPRCKYAMDICHQQEPELADINEAGTRKCRCHLLNKTGKEA